MASAVLPTPRGLDHEGAIFMATTESSASSAHPSTTPAEKTRCPRHEGEYCPRCDGSGFRPRRRCQGCGEPSGRPSEGGRALMGLKIAKGKDQPMWCLHCHPEHRYIEIWWAAVVAEGNSTD